MKRYCLLIAAGIFSAPAHAQMAQPIMLSPEEYTRLVSTLAERDPLIAMLLQKQREAVQHAAAQASPPVAAQPAEAK